jgi:hypothetical protein
VETGIVLTVAALASAATGKVHRLATPDTALATTAAFALLRRRTA